MAMRRLGVATLAQSIVLLCAAMTSFAQASLGAEYDQAVTQARQLLKENKHREAVTVSERAIKLDDSRWEAYVTAAGGYSGLGLYDDAIGLLQMALPRAPEDRKAAVRDALQESRRALNQSSANPSPKVQQGQRETGAAGSPTQAEIVLWKSIEKSSSPDDFTGYLKQYPNGVYSGIARTKLNSMEQAANLAADTALWKTIESSQDIEDFRAYLRKFPNGAYSELAKGKIDKSDWEAIANNLHTRKSIPALEEFIKTHPDSQYASQARLRIASITKEREGEAQTQAEQEAQQRAAAAERQRLRDERKRAGTFRQAVFMEGKTPGYLVITTTGYEFQPFNGAGQPVRASKEQIDRIRVTGAHFDSLAVRLKDKHSITYRCATESELLRKSRSKFCKMQPVYQSIMDVWGITSPQ
jgi:tetratricopeptide (TPR) repeat protein